MTRALAMLALVTDAFGGRGGIAQYNRDFLRSVANAYLPPAVLVLPRSAPHLFIVPSGVEQRPPRAGRAFYSLAAFALAMTRRVDIVFCGHLYMTPLALLIARLKRARSVVQMHGIDAWHRPSRLQRYAVEAADLVLCVSRHTRAAVLGWAALAPERVVVLPNTVGAAFTPGDASALRDELGLTDRRILLTVGRMDERERYKGHDRVIAAMPDLLARGHDIVYLIAGEGDDRPRLEALARDAGLAERVRFLGGVDPQRLVDLYRLADLFVMPSTGEGFGISFLEAIACGTRAVGLAVGGATDALADGTALSENDDLAAALDRLLIEPRPDRRTLAAAVQARFGRATFSASVDGVIRRLASGPTASLGAAA